MEVKNDLTSIHPLLIAAREVSAALDVMEFSRPVTHVYNPLVYAREPYARYVERYGKAPKKVLFLGMNPGPWGMAQTGVPFGDGDAVRNWLDIDGRVEKPPEEHPKRPVDGFECARGEVSGKRLWGLFAGRFSTPESFFTDHFVANYCPLLFLESGGRNRTPDKLPKEERERLFGPCDEQLLRTIEILSPRFAVGIGRFAESRLKNVLSGPELDGVTVLSILHPSPANPRANRDWEGEVVSALEQHGIW